MKNYKWMKIDTASIMFTCLSTKKWGRTFRMSAIFKDEEINPELLKKAAADLVARYPATHSYLKKGFFWNYLECTDVLPEIRCEYDKQLLPITYRNNGRPDFRIIYSGRRITCESAHHLGDGLGFGKYFGALLERYAELCDNPESEYVFKAPPAEELTNAFNDYYQKGGETADEESCDVYQIEGEIEKDFLQLIFAITSEDKLHEKAQEKGLTITEYLAAALILGTIRNASGPINKMISLAIPVNLRRFFPSETVRNFTIQSKIDFHPQGRTDWTFDEICEEIRGQLKKRLEPDELQKILNRFGSLANNPILKIVPNFIKLPVLRYSQRKSHGNSTTILTNTGKTELAPILTDRIERMEGINGDTSGYGLISTCSTLSCNGFLTLCFSVCSHNASWPKECIRVFAENGLDVRVESNYGNGEC